MGLDDDVPPSTENVDVDVDEKEETTEHYDETTPGLLLEEEGPIDNDENDFIDTKVPEETPIQYDSEEIEDDDKNEEEESKTPRDDCRGDDKFQCGKTSVYICEVEKCDGKKNCPNGEDEEDCPSISDNEGSGSDESENEIKTSEENFSTSKSPIIIGIMIFYFIIFVNIFSSLKKKLILHFSQSFNQHVEIF